MVGQGNIRRRRGTDRGDVDIEIMAERGLVEFREGHRIETLIVIGHVYGKHPPDVGHVNCHALEFLRDPVLAEQVHLMAQSGQRPR